MSESTKQPEDQLRDFAFYYPGHLWSSGDWIKNLLLFFDGIALLVPKYKSREPELLDPVMAIPLIERNMLHIFEAETMVDQAATAKLAEAMTDVITSGALDSLSKEGSRFHELSYSRLGGFGDSELADMIFSELKARGLARDSEDGVSIPMHPMVRALVLVLLSQILRPQGRTANLELSPATDRPELVEALGELLSIRTAPTTGKVVAFDLETVGVDLTLMPIDEVLSFREQHLDKHREYARNVRKFVQELSLMSDDERIPAFYDRKAELRDIAHDLETASRKAWKRPTSFALGLAGAATSLAGGNRIAALISVCTALLARKPADENLGGPYSYIFKAGARRV